MIFSENRYPLFRIMLEVKRHYDPRRIRGSKFAAFELLLLSPNLSERFSADLDNYPRLTCTWLHEGSQPAQPGLEAMFPAAGKTNESKP
jgi:hypothetical protein